MVLKYKPVTMANTTFLNNIHFWSGNPGKTFLVYTFGWGWMGVNTRVNTTNVIFFMMLGFKKEIFGIEGETSCQRRETESKENRNKCRKIA